MCIRDRFKSLYIPSFCPCNLKKIKNIIKVYKKILHTVSYTHLDVYKRQGLSPLYVGEVSSTGIYYPSVEELMTTWKTNTRWDELVFRDAPLSNNTTLSFSNSTEKTRINFSANYFTDQGVYIKDNYDKLGFNLKVDHKLYDLSLIHI